MKKLNLFGGLNALVQSTGFNLRRNAPGILVFSGVVGVVTSGVMACRATLKVNDTMKASREKIEEARTVKEPKAMKKQLAGAYIKTGLKLAELYLPSVGVGALSITAILSSHHLMTKRNTSLAAAYTTLDTMFKGYRARVKDKYGEDEERKLYYNIHEEEIEETIIGKNGKEQKVKKTVEVIDANPNDQYSRLFMKLHQDDPSLGSSYWDAHDQYGYTFLKGRELQANYQLTSRGYLTLNDVYVDLGFQPTLAGQSVGWVYDEENPVGDNFVFFDKRYVQYRNKDGSLEPATLIGFNVQGSILGRAVQKGLMGAT
jgi:hypothetical protein